MTGTRKLGKARGVLAVSFSSDGSFRIACIDQCKTIARKTSILKSFVRALPEHACRFHEDDFGIAFLAPGGELVYAVSIRQKVTAFTQLILVAELALVATHQHIQVNIDANS